jgi:DNA-directed RNA polymerase specialized sigma24 family protein
MGMTNEPEVAVTLGRMWQSFQSGNNEAGAIAGPPLPRRRDELVNWKDQQHMAEFEGRFSRCRNSLYFLALEALGNVGEAEEAMENCYRKTRRMSRRFLSDSDFGSWMIRQLINEIVLVANRRVPDPSEMNEAAYPEAR